jgi:vitamin B12 transporter
MSELPVADPPAIIVTASRSAETTETTPASVGLIDGQRIERLGQPLVGDLLRLLPSTAVSTSGPPGSLTQVRIRGAEANHTLLFVEGIRANDPAAGNEPRFELLNADLASRIEVVRGPQSALWGSEAIGGVVAVEGAAPGSGGTRFLTEVASHDGLRGAARSTLGNSEQGLSFGIAAQKSAGIDAFSGQGERDGYRNLGLRGSGRYRMSPTLLLSASGFAFRSTSQFDGYDPFTFQRADTLDDSRNRLSAGRIATEIGDRETSYALASASLLGSSNLNRLDGEPLNRTSARRRTVALEAGHRLGGHRFIAAVEDERESFHARDTAFGGFTKQDRTRNHQSIAVEWRAAPLGPISGGIAVRHDVFSRFKDATSVRASLRGDIGDGVSVSGNYGEGIAQPTFFDLYGFFPGSFVGNPSLKPEQSTGFDLTARLARGRFSGSATYFRQRLGDEIIDSPDFTSSVNAGGTSKRSGLELEASWNAGPWIRLSANYAYLRASERKIEGDPEVREQRRPRHSGAILADGSRGRWSYGASMSYVGRHRDRRDSLPYDLVDLDAYWLASVQGAYRLTGKIEALARISNAFGEQHQDLVGYRTEGRTIHAGIRLALGR